MTLRFDLFKVALLEAAAVWTLTACGGGSESASDVPDVGSAATAAADSSVTALSVKKSVNDEPVVSIVSSNAQDGASATVAGTASDHAAIVKIEWTNNRGGSGSATTGTPSGGDSDVNWTAVGIALKNGKNRITVKATDRSGKVGSASIMLAGLSTKGGGSNPVPPTPTPTPTPILPPSTGTTNLCSGLVQDKIAHPMTTVAKPGAGHSYVDPQFGTTIRRVSDSASGHWTVAGPMYSTVQAWNADESYMILYQTGGTAGAGHHLYNGKTYAHIKALDIDPADIEQVYWDTTNPKILYYGEASSHKLRRFNVDTDTQATAVVLHDFSTAPTNCSSSESLSGGSDPMWTSWNSKNIGLMCGNKLFSYNLATNTVGTVLSASTGGNAPQASPSGALFFLNNNGSVANVRDANMNLLRNLPLLPDEHASMGTADGRDTFFSVQFDGAITGTLVATNMGDATMRVIIGESTGYPYPPGGTHVSAMSYANPGWVAASIVGEAASNGKMGQGVLDNEVVLANANTGGAVCRVAHHHSCGSSDSCGSVGYFAEPHPVISPKGTRILYGSDWDGGATVDAYVVELPAYRP